MVLVYVESQGGGFKKAAFEAVYYGHKLAEMLGTSCASLLLGPGEGAGVLGKYGADSVHHVPNEALASFDSQVYASVIAGAAEKLGANVVVMSHSATGKSLLGRLAVKMEAGSVPGVNSLPDLSDGKFRVRKPVFSGKALADHVIRSERKLLSLTLNSLQPREVGAEVKVERLELEIPDSRVDVVEVSRVEGRTPLPEAEKVVSGGRGFKGPDHFDILEDLADALGAATACSRPVADSGWRPHHEHVGQTGITIRPNLYVAIGISGAIQHLAGVNNSKTIVVINKDPEAPFFKAADYGVVGDLFEVVPRLTKAVKAFRES